MKLETATKIQECLWSINKIARDMINRANTDDLIEFDENVSRIQLEIESVKNLRRGV